MRFRDHPPELSADDMPDVIKNSNDVTGASREMPIYSTVNKARNLSRNVPSHTPSPRFDRDDDVTCAQPPHYATYRPQNELERIYNQPNRGAMTVDRRLPRPHNTVTFKDHNPEQVCVRLQNCSVVTYYTSNI